MGKKKYNKATRSGKNISAEIESKNYKTPRAAQLTTFVEKYLTTKNQTRFFLFLAVCILFFVFKDFLIFKKLYLFKDIGSDTVTIYYPTFVHIAEYLRTDGLPGWSFSQGMGQNIYPGGINDPFSLILYAIGSEKLAFALGWIEFIKILASGYFFLQFLKMLKLTPFVNLAGALMFTFSGYLILGSGWYGPSSEVFYFSLIILAFERLYQKNSWWLLLVAVFLYAGVNILFTIEFLFFYSTFRFINDNGFNIKKLVVLYGKLAGIGILAFGLAAIFVLPVFIGIIYSPRVGGDAAYFNTLLQQSVFGMVDKTILTSTIMRLFSNDLIGSGSFFAGWNNYLESPILYIGLANLLLFPQVFQHLAKRNKILWAIFLVLWILPLIFPYFRYTFFFFSGDYFRSYSFFVSVVLLFFGLHALFFIHTNQKLNLPTLLALLVILFALLWGNYFASGSDYRDKNLMYFISFALCAYSVFIYFLASLRYRSIGQIAFLALLIIELAWFSNITVNNRIIPPNNRQIAAGKSAHISAREFGEKTGFNDYSLDAAQYLKNFDSTFYRVHKDFSSSPDIHGSRNDAKVQGYFGSSSYSSFNQLSYIRFLQKMNIIQAGNETQTRWAPGLEAPLLMTFGNVKYNISNQEQPPLLQTGYSVIEKFENISLLKNNFYLPFGYSYKNFITEKNMAELNDFQKQIMLLRAVVINNEDAVFEDIKQSLTEILPTDTISPFGFEPYINFVNALKQDSLEITHFEHNKIEGTINLKESKLLFFSIPFDNSWKAFVNNNEQKIEQVNFGFSGLFLPAGKHNIVLKYSPPYITISLYISLLSIVLLLCLIIIQLKLNKAKHKELP